MAGWRSGASTTTPRVTWSPTSSGTGGYDPVRVGGLDQPIRIEAFGDLHELGGLGRAVAKPEALKAI